MYVFMYARLCPRISDFVYFTLTDVSLIRDSYEYIYTHTLVIRNMGPDVLDGLRNPSSTYAKVTIPFRCRAAPGSLVPPTNHRPCLDKRGLPSKSTSGVPGDSRHRAVFYATQYREG